MNGIKRVIPHKPVGTKIVSGGTRLSIAVGKNKGGKAKC